MAPNEAHDDDLIMGLVERALARPSDERKAYVRAECGGRSELFSRVWNYVSWEQRMNGFLLDPLLPADPPEVRLAPGEFIQVPLKLDSDLDCSNRFEVIRCLGSGGMGVVYEVNDRQRDARVALKTLSKVNPESMYCFKNEFRTLSGITHPNLISLYELFAAGDVCFFTM